MEEDENPSPPICVHAEHGLMERKFTPLGISIGRTPREKMRRKRWQAERDHDEKEQSDNKQEVSENVEKWKKNYVAGELHHKHGTPDEPNTKAFKEAGHVPRAKTTIEHGFANE